MTQQVINIGTNANDGTGDTERAAFGKINANFTEVYAKIASAATYAAARLIPGVTTGDRLQVLGRTSQSDGGQGLFTWVAGGSTTVDEGYELSASGGIWRRVDPSPTTGETLLNAVWFNIKPINSDVTNDVGFAKLKAQMQTSGTTTWHVIFPPGAYTYTNNRWLFGVQKVIIEAYDCTFQCTWSTDGNFANAYPLNVNDFFEDWGDVVWPGNSTFASGYLFNTATAGATSITTTTHADAGNFTPGVRIVLHGYDQAGTGYPPNPRYFEYLTVLTANASTGVVTFTDQLKNSYDSRWWDTANYGGSTGLSVGAPRILSLERANFKQAKLIWFKGATFLVNPTTPAANVLQVPGDLVIYEDVQGPTFNVVESGKCILKRCNFKGAQNSGDKLVDWLIIEDSTLDSNSSDVIALADCVGCNNVSLIRSKFVGGVVTVSPRHLSIDDCDIIPSTSNFAGIVTGLQNPIRAVTIGKTRVYNTGGSVSFGFANVASPGNALTVGTVVGTDIRISFDATGKTVAYQIEYGMTLTNTVTGNTGIITAIYYETGAPGTLRIAGTWGTPAPGDVFHYYDVMSLFDGGGNVIVGTQVPFWRGPPLQALRDSTLANLTATGTATVGTLALSGTTSASSLRAASATQVDLKVNGVVLANMFSDNIALTNIRLTLGNATPLQIPEGGSPAIAGFATLVGGTKTVTNSLVTNASYALVLTRSAAGGTLGHLSYTITDFTSFTINSSSGTDTSTVYWVVIRRG